MNNYIQSTPPITPEVMDQDKMPEIQLGLINVGQSNIDCSSLHSQLEYICEQIRTTSPNELAKIASVRLAIPVAIVVGPVQIAEVTLK